MLSKGKCFFPSSSQFGCSTCQPIEGQRGPRAHGLYYFLAVSANLLLWASSYTVYVAYVCTVHHSFPAFGLNLSLMTRCSSARTRTLLHRYLSSSGDSDGSQVDNPQVNRVLLAEIGSPR